MAWIRWIAKRLLILFFLPLCLFRINDKQIFMLNSLSYTWGDNLKYLSKYIKKNYANELNLIYAYKSPEQRLVIKENNIKPVKYKTFNYFYYILTSKIIITNSGGISYLPIRPQQVVLNTWHGGGAYKKTGIDVCQDLYYIKDCQLNAKKTTAILLSCRKFGTLGVPSLCMETCEQLPFGLPRNDMFFENYSNISRKVKEKLDISKNKRIILYVPTFRNLDNNVLKKKKVLSSNLDIPKLLDVLTKRWIGDWIFLYRIHPMSSGTLYDNVDNSLDVSSYEDAQELLSAADIMITDYSSIMWDFILTQKPCFVFAPDIDEYSNNRNFYMPIKTWPLSISTNNEELFENINIFDEVIYKSNIQKHLSEMGSYETGSASEHITEWMLKKI